MELHATPEEVMRAVEALDEFGRVEQVSENVMQGLTVALEECASNIVNHALKRDAQLKFCVTLEHRGGRLSIELRDPGPPFDPTAFSKPAPTEDDEPGGWGIQLVRRYTDAISYRREGAENVLLLTKSVGESPRSTTNCSPESKSKT
jgi:anti-sigma regulatory factor (Ser/Thr protein kinase)